MLSQQGGRSTTNLQQMPYQASGSSLDTSYIRGWMVMLVKGVIRYGPAIGDEACMRVITRGEGYEKACTQCPCSFPLCTLHEVEILKTGTAYRPLEVRILQCGRSHQVHSTEKRGDLHENYIRAGTGESENAKKRHTPSSFLGRRESQKQEDG